jgi:hypothetical protein
MSDGRPDPPGYELAPSPVARRSSRSAVVAVALAGLVLGGAVVAAVVGDVTGPGPIGVSVARGPAVPPTSAVATAPEATPGPVTAVLPLWVTCHDLAAQRCQRLAQAVVSGIDDPTLSAPSSVEVWGSIACGSDFDCPPFRLDGRHPAGSVVVAFSGAVTLWVNVTELDRVGAGGPIARPLEVWVIRSQPTG